MEPSVPSQAASQSSPTGLLPSGTRLGEYEIERVIGSGGMGTVYAAWHPVLRGRAAIKVLNIDVSHNASMVDRFVSEAQAASRISHPNIIKVFGFGELPDGRKYFVMEYLEGESMAAWLSRGLPDPSEALTLLLQVCEALEAAHREGIVHRDLKPDNLWIARPKHGRAFIKVLDFGIAKAVEGPVGKSNTKTGSVLGTPQFMSPEQCTGRGVDHRTDIYALGGILYCVYCGRPPFERESPAELVAAHLYATVPMPTVFASVPPALERLILACLEKNPDKRPQSAAELAARLREAAAPEAMAPSTKPPQAPTAHLLVPTAIDDASPDRGPTRPEPVALDAALDADEARWDRPGRRSRWRWPLVVAGVAALGGAGVWLAVRRAPAPILPAPEPVLPAEATPTAAPPLPPAPPSRPAAAEANRARTERPTRKTRGHPRSSVPVAVPPADTPGAPPAVPPTKPSRTVREGLIEENPFR